MKFSSLAVCVLLVLAACSRKASENAAEEEEKYGVSTADSISIIESTNEIMALLQQKDIEAASQKLYVLNLADTTVSPIGEEEVSNLNMRNRIFPVVQYEVYETDFSDPLYNSVVYDVAFANPDPETGEAPKTKMAFNIINLDGKLYVTTMDKNSLPKGY